MTHNRWLRFLIGFGLTLAVVVAGFAIVDAIIPTWGATASEVAAVYPGDELIPTPAIAWTYGVTVNAPAEQVYPWLVQMGDTRGGYYSYMFIEHLFGPSLYNNADRIHPEWQQPQPGLGVIADMVAVQGYQPGSWFQVGGTPKLEESGLKWTWTWQVNPIDAGHARLINRMRIGVPASMAGNPVLGFMLNNGGFVMEQNMMQGIAQRAEGRGEWAYIEPLEIVLWLAALICGLWAARLFLRQAIWWKALCVGLLAVSALFVLTFVQPPIWSRALIDALLVAGAVWAREPRA